MPGKRTVLYPIPGVFIPGVPAVETEFESQAEADRFMEGETGGIRHDSAFASSKAEASDESNAADAA